LYFIICLKYFFSGHNTIEGAPRPYFPLKATGLHPTHDRGLDLLDHNVAEQTLLVVDQQAKQRDRDQIRNAVGQRTLHAKNRSNHPRCQSSQTQNHVTVMTQSKPRRITACIKRLAVGFRNLTL